MQAGFAMLESGFTRAKNAVNIMMKNIMDFCIGTLAFLIIGFHLMFAGPNESSFFLGDTAATQWGFPFWLFQCVFAATTATIVSGGVAERTKFTGYIAYSIVICALIYPMFGSWAWGSLLDGNGWLEGVLGVGFYDFAGSTVVHSTGGWLALAYAFFGVETFSMKVLAAQAIGIGAGFFWAFGTGMTLFLSIKHTIGLRVPSEDEITGLDITEYGNEAYVGLPVDSHA